MKTKNETRDLFYSDVERIPTEELGFNSNSYNEFSIVVDTPKKKTLVNQCSKDYLLVSNRELFLPIEQRVIENLGEENVEIKYTIKNHSEFTLSFLFKRKDLIQKIGKKRANDIIFPTVDMSHSYNGRIPYMLNEGIFRQVCKNGLWGVVSTGNSINQIHCIGNTSQIIDATIESITKFLETSHESLRKMEVLMEKSRSREEAVKVVETLIEKGVFYKSLKDDVLNRLFLEGDKESLGFNDWMIYNAFNFQLNHNEKINIPKSEMIKRDTRLADALISF